MPVNFPVRTKDHVGELTAPYNELEAFDSIWDALRWKHIRKRVSVCFKKTLHNRYMLANLVYLGYTIVLLVIDFHPDLDGGLSNDCITMDISNETVPLLDQPVVMNEYGNRLYIGLAVVNLFVAFLYICACRGRSWIDVVLIPEYLNHVQAVLYLWSSIWYSKQDTLGGYYTMAIHKIELTASCTELCASIGWMVSWYMTYTRTIGRGFTFDDPDTMGYLATTSNTIIYLVYNIKMNIHPEQYGVNQTYIYADVLGFIGAIYYTIATLRDDNWFWFLPLAGQYGIAAGKIHADTGIRPQCGLPDVLITDLCKRRKPKSVVPEKNMNHINIDLSTGYL